ncbi:MAG: hypothetical protein F6J93_36165 [Oscillatoria sp. SIO1A7]|nr:hypothetical protein [Oscillatoria sp. SIO1A7]
MLFPDRFRELESPRVREVSGLRELTIPICHQCGEKAHTPHPTAHSTHPTPHSTQHTPHTPQHTAHTPHPTPHSTHPTPRVLTLWGKRKGGFHAVFVSPSEGAKILAVIGFRDFRTAAIPAGRQCAEKTSESTPYPTPHSTHPTPHSTHPTPHTPQHTAHTPQHTAHTPHPTPHPLTLYRTNGIVNMYRTNGTVIL